MSTASASARAPASSKDRSKPAPKPAPQFKTRTSQAKSKKEALVLLIEQVSKMNDEVIVLAEKLNSTQSILEAILQDAKDAGVNNIDLEADIEYEDEDLIQTVEYDGVEYHLNDVVELYDSANKKWTNKTAKIFKFCEKMARMRTKTGGKTTTTKRIYGNFRKRSSS